MGTKRRSRRSSRKFRRSPAHQGNARRLKPISNERLQKYEREIVHHLVKDHGMREGEAWANVHYSFSHSRLTDKASAKSAAAELAEFAKGSALSPR